MKGNEMKTESMKKINRIVRFTGGGALLLAMIGLISLSPLTASGQDALPVMEEYEAVEVGGHHFGAVHAGPRFELGGGGMEFFRIVFDLTDEQVEELTPLVEEHMEQMMEMRREARGQRRHAARMNRSHRRCCCDNVDRTEMRAKMRRQRRESEKTRTEMRKRAERHRGEFEEKLEKILDEDQMRKYRELRELREERREERRERREEMRGRRA
jgi:hypothetical protein